MHRIVHLSPVGCFTPARGKTVQKNREVSGVNAAYESQDLLQQPWLEHASKGMPDRRTACAATHRVTAKPREFNYFT